MITIQTPYVQFTELDGSPLDDGAVYIGTAGLNPQTNPITVYWDNAGTQPAAQPLSTRAGVIARNGAPARVYISASSYSLMVRDKRGRLLASELTISTSVDASGITDGTITEVKLDAALVAKINGALQTTGGTMTGAIVLPGNATNALEAVPLQQLDSVGRSKIASITVTVNANAMTATLQPETLDFRSTNLTNGSPVSRSATVAASLTVPSAATLGTVNGQAARIVWGWLDNAGTLEPFVVNLSGGINLDETTLISTTAISGTANSAGVAYSQTARTNVAFRVRGFCDVTQATAGTWATGPSLVQGAGGQALAALSSLGYGQTWQSVVRSSGVTYYNTTGRPINIFISANVGSGASGGSISLSIGSVVFNQVVASGSAQIVGSANFTVPPGGSYVYAQSGIVSLVSVFELR